jgi:hypothetical protein
MNKRLFIVLATSLALTIPSLSPAHAAGTETAITPEVNPPGDIPDSQVFIRFDSPDGFSFKVPEGWARSDAVHQSTFNDKYNRIAISSSDWTKPLNMALAKETLAPAIERAGRAVKIMKIVAVKLKSGDSIRVIYESNSEPNAVTNKQVREENETFYYAGNGKLVRLDLSAPKGADNVDQWKLISSSFRWK